MVWKMDLKSMQNTPGASPKDPSPTESKKRSGDFKTPPLHERSKKSFLRDQVEKTRLHIDFGGQMRGSKFEGFGFEA